MDAQKGVWIPAVIWDDPKLSAAAKCLVGRINHELGLTLGQIEIVKQIAQEFFK